MNKTNISFVVMIAFLITIAPSSSVLGYGGPPAQSSSGNYSVNIIFDKETYALGEIIVISGNVNKYDEERVLKITIFDKDQNLVLNEKLDVNSDNSFSYEIIQDSDFSEGKYTVRAQYGTSKVTVEKTSFVISSSSMNTLEQTKSKNTTIPEWIRSNAGWWADGEIDDDSFVQGIQFLIKEGLMIIPITEQGSSSQDNNIPEWIKNNAGWWADGEIDDDSFVQGIQFLIKEGLMRVS